MRTSDAIWALATVFLIAWLVISQLTIRVQDKMIATQNETIRILEDGKEAIYRECMDGLRSN